MRPRAWVPPVVWMGVILVLSTDTGSAEHTGRFLVPLLRLLWPGASPLQIEALHGLVRKAAHLTEYAVLAGLWWRALTTGRGWSASRAAWAALGISVAWAMVDEGYQALSPSRTPSPIDVAIDGAGATISALAAARGWRAAVDSATGLLLWIAGGGGAVALALNLALDTPVGLLWLTTPLAALALAYRQRRRHREARRTS